MREDCCFEINRVGRLGLPLLGVVLVLLLKSPSGVLVLLLVEASGKSSDMSASHNFAS